MGLRRLINLAEAHLMKGASVELKSQMKEMLNERFDHELTEAERKRAERKRVAIETGAFQSQQQLVSAFSLRAKR